MTTLLLLSVYATMCFAQDAGTRLPSVFPRPNLGVVFTKTDVLIAGHTPYLHTFLTPVPRLLYEPLPPPVVNCTNNTPLVKALTNCDVINANVVRINAEYADLFSVVQRELKEALSGVPSVAGMPPPAGKRKRRLRVRRDTTQDYDEGFHHFNPEWCRPGYPVPSENWFGRLSESISGQPSHADLDVIRQHICILAKATDVTKQQIIRLGRTVTAVSNKLTNDAEAMYAKLDAQHDAFVSTRNEYTQLLNATVHDLGRLDERVHFLEAAQRLMVTLAGKLRTHAAAADKHLRAARLYAKDVDQLVGGGRLRPSIVPVRDMIAALDFAKSNLEKDDADRAADRTTAGSTAAAAAGHVLVHSNPAYYYEAARPVVTFLGNNLIVGVNIDVRARTAGGLLGIYRVDRTFLSLDARTYLGGPGDDSKVGSVRVENLPDFFAISPDLRYGVSMSAAEVITCTGRRWNADVRFGGSSHTVCKDQALRNMIKSTTCVSAIFRDDKAAVKTNCVLSLEKRDVPTQAVKVSPDTYLVHSPVNATAVTTSSSSSSSGGGEPSSELSVVGPTTLTIRCPDASTRDGSVIKTIRGCSTCLVRLGCGCSMTSADFNIPVRRCGRGSSATSRPVASTDVKDMIGFPINAHAALGKYSVKRVERILATDTRKSIFRDVPVRLDDLDDKLNFTAYNFSGLVMRLKPYADDFKAALASAKRFGKTYANEAAKLYDRVTDYSDLSGSHFKDLYDRIKNPPLSGKTATIVSGTSMMGVAIASAVFTAYLCCCNKKR